MGEIDGPEPHYLLCAMVDEHRRTGVVVPQNHTGV
jgi:hypothetical protein